MTSLLTPSPPISISHRLTRCRYSNRPFPSSKKSHFQSKAKCEAIDMKMIFNYDANKTHFHNKGFALSLVLKVRIFGTRKWPILHYVAASPPSFSLPSARAPQRACSQASVGAAVVSTITSIVLCLRTRFHLWLCK